MLRWLPLLQSSHLPISQLWNIPWHRCGHAGDEPDCVCAAAANSMSICFWPIGQRARRAEVILAEGSGPSSGQGRGKFWQGDPVKTALDACEQFAPFASRPLSKSDPGAGRITSGPLSQRGRNLAGVGGKVAHQRRSATDRDNISKLPASACHCGQAAASQ